VLISFIHPIPVLQCNANILNNRESLCVDGYDERPTRRRPQTTLWFVLCS